MSKLPIQWQEIEEKLDNLRPVEGGFSQTIRGLITMEDGTNVFVKIGASEDTRRWTKKEIDSYRFLEKHNYPHIPQLLSVNSDETGFAISAHTSDEGWDWKSNWDCERLEKSFEAIEKLAAIKPVGADLELFLEKSIDESHDGWRQMLESTEAQQKLLDKLRDIDCHDIADKINFALEAEKSSQFVFRNDALVHNDVRADNFAWNSVKKELRLIDWNWVQMGDRRIDLAASMTHVYISGFDILPRHTSRLDADALHWIAGFWFNAALKPIWEGGPGHLRQLQILSGVAALGLRDKITKNYLI